MKHIILVAALLTCTNCTQPSAKPDVGLGPSKPPPPPPESAKPEPPPLPPPPPSK